MRRRLLMCVVVIAVMGSACSESGDGGTDGGASSQSVTSVSSVASTEPPASTTVEVPSSATEPLGIDEFWSPTGFVDSFSFDYSMLEFDDGAFGIVSVGVFVIDDAVSCEAGNPGLVGGSFGMGTAIGDDFWFDDGFMAPTRDDRGGEYAAEWLAWCPGAPEYWEQPIYADERFVVSLEGPGDAISGFATQTYVVASASDELVVDEGRVWVTEEGWPIRVEISGDVLGGVFSFFNTADSDDLDLPAGMIPFEIDLLLTEFNAPSHLVRSPDRSAVVGPLGDVVAAVPGTAPPTGELADKIESALDTACGSVDSIRDITPSADLTVLEPSQVNVSIVDGSLTQTYPGMAYGGSPTYQVVTASGSEVSLLQAELLFNHRAPIAALYDWIGSVPPDMTLDGQLHISIASTADSEGVIDIAAWDGTRIVYADGPANDVSYHAYLSMPEPDLALSKAIYRNANTRLQEWTATASDIAQNLAAGDLQAAANLEALYRDLDTTKALACTILATRWAAADKAASGNASDATLYDRYIDEIAGQHLLLAIEYANALGRYLDQPHVDWLRADNIDLDRGLLAGDTDGTILGFFSDLLGEALSYSDPASFG